MKTYIIHTDGSPAGFVMVDEDGNKVEGIMDATIRMDPNSFPTVDLTMRIDGVNAKVVIDTIWHECLSCGEAIEHECPPRTLSGFP